MASRLVARLLVLCLCSLRGHGARRSGPVALRPSSARTRQPSSLVEEEGRDIARERRCRCPGSVIATSDVRATVVPEEGHFRLRRAAQRICDERFGRGDLGAVPAAAVVYYSCEVNGRPVGYCCQAMRSVVQKRTAPAVLEEKDIELYAQVNVGYAKLQRALKVATISEQSADLSGAALLLARHRMQIEQKEALCRTDADNLEQCGDPLFFLVNLRLLYRGLLKDIERLTAAAAACTSIGKRMLAAALHGRDRALAVVPAPSSQVATAVVNQGRRVAAFIWRNRVLLFAGVVAVHGAQPLIQEMTEAGLHGDEARPIGESFEEVVVALKGVACRLLQEPVLMASVVSMVARVFGTVLVSVFPEGAVEKPANVSSQGSGSDRTESDPRQASFVRRARAFGNALRSSGGVPVVSQLLVLIAAGFFRDLSGAICTALSPVDAVEPPVAVQAAAMAAATAGTEAAAMSGAMAAEGSGPPPPKTPLGIVRSNAAMAFVSRSVQNELFQRPDFHAIKEAKSSKSEAQAPDDPEAVREPQFSAHYAVAALMSAVRNVMDELPPPPSPVPPVTDESNAITEGALGGLLTFTGSGFVSIGASGVTEVLWAPPGTGMVPRGSSALAPTNSWFENFRLQQEQAARERGLKKNTNEVIAPAGRRGRRGRRKSKNATSLLQGSAGADRAQAESAEDAEPSMLGRALLELADRMPQTPDELASLEAALRSARVYLPLFTILSWTAERMLPVLAQRMGGEGAYTGEAPRNSTELPIQGAHSLSELKAFSKRTAAEVARLADAAMARCGTRRKK